MSPRTSTAAATQPATTKRAYNSSRRKRQAAETRAEVLAAAIGQFGESGWSGTTVAAIAEAAGVAVETVYSGFGSKKALLRDAADAAVVGDAEPIPYVDRPEFAALGEGPTSARVQAGMDFLADTHGRTSGVWRALEEAAESDDDLRAWATGADERRHLDVRRSLERIFDRPIEGPMLDALWVLYGHETYRKLVLDRGYTRAEYQRSLAEATLRLLGEDLGPLDAFD